MIWDVERWQATTDFVVLCLVASGWDYLINNDGFLHPNGEDGHPWIADFREGLRYFGLHGPFSVKQKNLDFILGDNNRWGFLQINRDGEKRDSL